MVKKSFVLVLAIGAMAALGQMHSAPAVKGMEESASDYVLANKGVNVKALRSESVEEFKYSKTFVQTGKNTAGYEVLRFATAVKGDFESLTYTRFAVEGATAGSAQAQEVVTPVTTLYKSIEDSQGSAYYNGTEVVHEASDETEGWLWACYSITFTNETYKASEVKVQLTAETANGPKELEARSASLEGLKDEQIPGFEEMYVGRKYEGHFSFEVIDEKTVVCSYSGLEKYTVTARVVSLAEDGTYTLANNAGEGFTLSFKANSALVKDFKYLVNGEMKEEKNYNNNTCEYQIPLTSFTLKYLVGVKEGYKTLSEGTSYDFVQGDSIYLTVDTNDDAAASISSAKSSEDSVISVEEPSSKSVKINFVKEGSARVTVVVKDVYGTSISHYVDFNVAKKVVPTADNWDITHNYLEVEGGAQVTDEVRFSIKWKDGDPTVDWSVEWSLVEGTENAKITRDGKEAIFSASAAGTYTVQAKLDKNDEFVKTYTINVSDRDEGALDGEIVGVWMDDYYGAFSFTVEKDGSAVFDVFEYESFDFNYVEKVVSSYDTSGNPKVYSYIFECSDDPSIIVTMTFGEGSSADATLYIEDDEYVINGYLYIDDYNGNPMEKLN